MLADRDRLHNLPLPLPLPLPAMASGECSRLAPPRAVAAPSRNGSRRVQSTRSAARRWQKEGGLRLEPDHEVQPINRRLDPQHPNRGRDLNHRINTPHTPDLMQRRP